MANSHPIHRTILDHWIWIGEKFTSGQAWVDLILLARHNSGKIRHNGKYIDIKRGEVGWSEEGLAKRWKWSRGKVRRFISMLKKEQMIVHRTVHRKNFITLCNYNRLHKEAFKSSTSLGTSDGTMDGTTDGTQTIKNKKEEEGKKKKTTTKFEKPTINDIADYCKKNGYTVDPEGFYFYYEANGWKVGKNKMKKWEAALVTWQKREKATQTKPKQAETIFEMSEEDERIAEMDFNRIAGENK